MFSALLIGIFIGCKSSKKQSTQAGVYKTDKITVSVGGKDSVYARTQMKIYTDNCFAYASLAPDSSVGFGVGYYKLDTGNHVIENNVYSSRVLDSTDIFHLAVSRKDSGYTQVLPLHTGNGTQYTVKEVYTQLPPGPTSKIDGVWKLDKAYIAKGKDTAKLSEIQFKAFWGGHFMFIHRYPVDNANTRYKNGFGYGDFTLKNDTLSETENLTSHPTLMGRTFAIKISFTGDNEYSQIITDAKTGDKSVEIYRKLQ
jgi:hypothetical protein